MGSSERKPKKQKTAHAEEGKLSSPNTLQSSKRQSTISVAIPTSILSSSSTPEQQIQLIGRIARTTALFSIDEVVIFDDSAPSDRSQDVNLKRYTAESDPGHFLTHVLSYLEAPPFMRKALFPLHPNLRLTALLPSLDMPHHPRQEEDLVWREGVVVSGQTKSGSGSLVQVGLDEQLDIDEVIPPKTRVTLKVSKHKSQTPECVHPAAPKSEGGYYWGYNIRRCSSLSAVFTESSYEGGYDAGIGATDDGATISQEFAKSVKSTFSHGLIVFGGTGDLEAAAENDPDLAGLEVEGNKAKELFDHWVNVLPNKGTRILKAEEAFIIGLAALQILWEPSSSL